MTIFISTHFMNEAERCDRISLMHAGRVLAVGAPPDGSPASGVFQRSRRHSSTVSRTPIRMGTRARPSTGFDGTARRQQVGGTARLRSRRFDVRRLWAYARREAMEILRDPVRLAFALLGPLILLATFGYGVSLDVENLTYAVFDHDRTRESRDLLENLAGSRYFARAARDQRHRRDRATIAQRRAQTRHRDSGQFWP